MNQQPNKWQNLLERRCVKCGSSMDIIGRAFVCPEKSECGFIITTRKWADILMDPDHVIQRFMSPTDRDALMRAVEEMCAAALE